MKISDAVAKYNAEHAREWPMSNGPCPMCKHDGCFGRLPGASGRWACFSTSHGPDSGRIGIQGSKIWHGDALDVDAHAAHLSRVDLLRREGYLEPARSAGREGRDGGGANPIIIVTTEVADVVDQAEAALLAACADYVYERGNVLVRIAKGRGRSVRGFRRRARAPRAEPIPDASLLELLAKFADWLKPEGKNLKPVLPPGWAVKVLGSRGRWRFRPLEGIVETPVLRPDGTVLATPGYDDRTALLYEPLIEFPEIPTEPTRDDALSALGDLLNPFEEFPFVAESDRAGTVASILTIVGRHAIDGPTPLFAKLAHAPGTGKGLLVLVASLIATGGLPAVTTAFQEDEELRKFLTAVVLEGQRVVLFDNAENKFGSGVLAGALTAPTWQGRVLGVSRTVEAPLQTVMFVTGNNISFVGDTHRRVVPIFLDARVERPEERVFKRPNLLRFVRKNRPRLLIAALTALRAFHVAGRPTHSLPLMGSYEDWDNLIRCCVMWLMDADPIAGRERIRREGSAELEQMRALFRALHDVFHDRSFTAAEALRQTTDHPDLRSAIDGVESVSHGSAAGAQALGFALRRWIGRVALGLRLERAGEAREGVLWKVVRAGGTVS